jgi:hypothetical protein
VEKRRFRVLLIITVLAPIVVVFAAYSAFTFFTLRGTGPASGPSVPSSGAPPSSVEPGAEVPRQVLLDFLDGCRNGLQQWREGQVDYPGTLTVGLDSSSSYIATVNIGPDAASGPPPRKIPGSSPERRPVWLQCAVAARLTTTGDNLDIDEDDWVVRTFTPSGVLDWNWSLNGRKLGSQDVRLELQPAVAIAEGGEFDIPDSPTQTAGFVTTVTVTGSWPQLAGKWWGENWPVLAGIAAALGAAVIALVRWRNEVRAAVREGRQGADPAADGSSQDPPAGAAPGSGAGPPAGTSPGP